MAGTASKIALIDETMFLPPMQTCRPGTCIPGDMETCRLGTCRHGDLDICRTGDLTWKLGDLKTLETWRLGEHGDLEPTSQTLQTSQNSQCGLKDLSADLDICRPGDIVWRPGDLETWGIGDLETWNKETWSRLPQPCRLRRIASANDLTDLKT